MPLWTLIALLAGGWLLTLALGFTVGWYVAWRLAQEEAAQRQLQR